MFKRCFGKKGLLLLIALFLSACPGEISAQSAESLETSFVRVAEEVGPSVVSISTLQIQRVRAQRYPYGGFGQDPHRDFFEEFFRDFFGEIPEKEYQRRGFGSGVIIDEEGLILTNEHVVSGADEITVILPDGREFKGSVTGTDVRSDLAIIKIDADHLPAAPLGNSDSVRIGQWAIAIGNPFGHFVNNPEPTVTAGVVSATGRSLPRTNNRNRDYSNLIQTDAAINPGNSGGPLVNLKGEVIGINVAIFSTTGGYQGVSFAIPINSAKRVMDRLIEGKKVVYGWLGVHIQDITADLQEYFSLPDQQGVLVAGVVQGGPAALAGLREGDIIRSVDGIPVENTRGLLKEIGQREVGEKVSIDLLRGSREMKLEVRIDERPEDTASLQIPSQKSWRGLLVQEVTPGLVKEYALQEETGVIVVGVEPGSPAEKAGLQSGDIINQMNRVSIHDFASYQKAIQSIRGDCLIRTHRGFAVLREK